MTGKGLSISWWGIVLFRRYIGARSERNTLMLTSSAFYSRKSFNNVKLRTSNIEISLTVWLPGLVNKCFLIFCGFDADKTGDALADKMINLYPTAKRLRPSRHDWNEVLKSSLPYPNPPYPRSNNHSRISYSIFLIYHLFLFTTWKRKSYRDSCEHWCG